MSDLHILNWAQSGGANYLRDFITSIKTDADVLILAGDIVSWAPRHVLWSAACLRQFADAYKYVVYAAGNHCFYGTSIEAGLNEIASANLGSNVHFLEASSVAIDNQRFLGGTLWQPKPPPGHIANINQISDHHCIRDFGKDAPKQFQRLHAYLYANITPNDVVITHHAPSQMSVASQWIGNPCNRWFITDEMQPMILEKQPRLYIHGHVHSPFSYNLGATRVVCNPLGYVNEGVVFNRKLVVEIQ